MHGRNARRWRTHDRSGQRHAAASGERWLALRTFFAHRGTEQVGQIPDRAFDRFGEGVISGGRHAMEARETGVSDPLRALSRGASCPCVSLVFISSASRNVKYVQWKSHQHRQAIGGVKLPSWALEIFTPRVALHLSHTSRDQGLRSATQPSRSCGESSSPSPHTPQYTVPARRCCRCRAPRSWPGSPRHRPRRPTRWR